MTIKTPPFAQPTVAARYRAGTPARAAARLYLAMVYNDPATAVRFFVPAWKLTPRKLFVAISVVQSLGSDARLVSQSRHGSQATLVFKIGSHDAVLDLERVKGSWKLDAVRLAGIRLSAPDIEHQQHSGR